MREVAVALGAAAVLAGAAGCGGGTREAEPVARVLVTDNAFRRDGRDRPALRVRRGDVVRWEWRAQESHQVSVRSGPTSFASPTKTRGGYERTFTRTGTYRLECSLHAPGMRMSVVVG